MRQTKNKGPLRNFHLLKEADEALVRYSAESGQDMTVVLEDLLLGRRQFSPRLDRLIEVTAKSLGINKEQVLVNAIFDYLRNELLLNEPSNSSGATAKSTGY